MLWSSKYVQLAGDLWLFHVGISLVIWYPVICKGAWKERGGRFCSQGLSQQRDKNRVAHLPPKLHSISQPRKRLFLLLNSWVRMGSSVFWMLSGVSVFFAICSPEITHCTVSEFLIFSWLPEFASLCSPKSSFSNWSVPFSKDSWDASGASFPSWLGRWSCICGVGSAG